MRHNDRFLAGVEQAIGAHSELRAQLAAAVRFTLDTAADDPLFKAVLAAESSAEFLPLITRGGAPIIVAARERLSAVFLALHPDLRRTELEVAAETVTRLTLSHILLPLHATECIAEQIAELASLFLSRPAAPAEYADQRNPTGHSE